MNLDLYREFATLAESENFQEAADRLFLSDSTLARHLRIMETELGFPLFDRTAKGVLLNKYGRAMLPYAREAAEMWDACLEDIYSEKLRNEHEISVITGYNITPRLVKFHRQNASSFLKVIEEEDQPGIILQHLRDRNYKFAVTAFSRLYDANDLETRPIEVCTYYALVSERHPLASFKSLPARAVQDEVLLDTMRHETETDPILIRYFENHGFQPKLFHRSAGLNEVMDAVNRGEGISIRRSTETSDPLREGRVLNYPEVRAIPFDPPIDIDIRLCWFKSLPVSDIDKAFIMCMTESARSL